MPDIYRRIVKISSILVLCSLSVSIIACKGHKKNKKKPVTEDFVYDDFQEKLKLLMPAGDTTDKKKLRFITAAWYTYLQGDYDPIWLAHGYTACPAADKYLGELEEVRWDGLDPETYHLTALKKLKEKLGGKETTLADAISFDTLMTSSFLRASKDLLLGRVSAKKADSLWYHANDSVWNAPAQLAELQLNYTPLDAYRSKVPTYALLRNEYKHYTDLAKDTNLVRAMARVREADETDSETMAQISYIVKQEAPWIATATNDTVSEWAQLIGAYQGYMGLKATGKADSTTLKCLCTPPDSLLPVIAANMERVRWMQRDFGSLYVLVDVPLMQLFLRRGGENAMHMNVVVGKPVRQTPSLYATMANVVLNPQWGVPPTILKQDVLPGLEKTGSKYMRKKGLKAYDHEGNVVDVSLINENNYKRFTYKQAPGDDNALGYVKFNLPNPWDIYLHDTPHRGDFGKRDRALSSGCIRLQQPKEMAVFVLSELEQKKFSMDDLDSIVKTHKTQWRLLSHKIPVHITYLTAFEDTTGTHINFVKDIYGRDGKLISLLGHVQK